MPRKCPSCSRYLIRGEEIYACEICEADCCTACSDSVAQYFAVCDACLEAGLKLRSAEVVAMAETKPKLLGCPFCGSAPEECKAGKGFHKREAFIRCRNGHYISIGASTVREARRLWNTRA